MVATMGDVGRRSSGVGGPFQKRVLLSAPVALITLAAPDHMARSARIGPTATAAQRSCGQPPTACAATTALAFVSAADGGIGGRSSRRELSPPS